MLTTARGPRARGRWRIGLGLALIAGLTACGEGSAAPTPQDTASQSFSGLQPQEARFLDVQVTVTGTLTATADWTSSSNDVDIYMTGADCRGLSAADLFVGRRCNVLARAAGTNNKPEVLQAPVTAGNLRVWVANFGPAAESGTLSVTVVSR